jgi:hypothetical protein
MGHLFFESFRSDVGIKVTAGIFRIHSILPLITKNEQKLKDENLSLVFSDTKFFSQGQAFIQ